MVGKKERDERWGGGGMEEECGMKEKEAKG